MVEDNIVRKGLAMLGSPRKFQWEDFTSFGFAKIFANKYFSTDELSVCQLASEILAQMDSILPSKETNTYFAVKFGGNVMI